MIFRIDRQAIGLAAFATLAMTASVAPVHASSDTPKDRYNMDVTCSAAAAAALKAPLTPEVKLEDARTLQTLYARRLQSSAEALGIAPARSQADVDNLLRSVLQNIRTPASAAHERKETAELAKDCAALPVIEVLSGVRPRSKAR